MSPYIEPGTEISRIGEIPEGFCALIVARTDGLTGGVKNHVEGPRQEVEDLLRRQGTAYVVIEQPPGYGLSDSQLPSVLGPEHARHHGISAIRTNLDSLPVVREGHVLDGNEIRHNGVDLEVRLYAETPDPTVVRVAFPGTSYRERTEPRIRQSVDVDGAPERGPRHL